MKWQFVTELCFALFSSFLLFFLRRCLIHNWHRLILSPSLSFSSEEAAYAGWVATAGGFSEDTINALAPLENNSVLAGGAFTSSILIGENGHNSNQLGFDDTDGFIAIVNDTSEWNFSESFGSIGVDTVESLAIMSDGDFIIAGAYCLGSAGLQCNMTLGSLPTLGKNEDSDEGNAYIARYDVDSGVAVGCICCQPPGSSFVRFVR